MKSVLATALAVLGVTVVVAGQGRGRGAAPALPRVTEEIPVVADLAREIHFYHDVLGLQSPNDPRAHLEWWETLPFLEDMYGGVGGQLRNVHFLVAGPPFQIEPIEWRNAKGKALNPKLQDTGAALLILHSTDLDKVMGFLKEGGAKPVTTGGAPVAVADAAGVPSRAIVYGDPNGFYLELIQPLKMPVPERNGPGPGGSATAPRPELYISSADVAVTVGDLEKSAQFFRDVFGVIVKIAPLANAETKQMDLFGMKGAQYREAVIAWPDNTPRLSLMQFTGIEHKTLTPLVADPNATLIRLTVADMVSTLAKIKAFPDAKVMNISGGPTTPEMRYDHVPWLIVRVPGSSTYLQIVEQNRAGRGE